VDGRAVVKRLLSRPAVSRVVTTPLRRVAPLLPAETFLRVPVVREFVVRIPASGARFRMHSGGDDDTALLAFWHGLEGRASRPGKPTASRPDAHTLRVLLDLGGRCQTFFDVGANVGLYALAMATAHGELLVHAFEPAPATFERLRRNVALNARSNLFIHREALAADVGTATLHIPRRGAPLDASLLEGMRLDTDPVTVPTTTVDAFAAAHGLRVDLLKLDTEGTEDQVLAGAQATLAANASFVVCEVLRGEPAEQRVGPMMADLGYRAFLITASGPQAVDDVCGDPAYAELNFLFAHRDRLGELPFRA